MSKIVELLQSPATRKAILDVLPRLVKHESGHSVAYETLVPINRIAWCADHRLNGLPKNVDTYKWPVSLSHVKIQGESIYLADDGNHRIERCFEAGEKYVNARVYDAKGVYFGVVKRLSNDEYALTSEKHKQHAISRAEAEALKALAVVYEEPFLVEERSRKRQRFLERVLGLGS
jgi:hypothetical protein